jgi:hypothetical protein
MIDPNREKLSTDEQPAEEPIAEEHQYEVRVTGKASAALCAELGSIRAGKTSTELIFELPDQAALHGLMRRLESLGLEVISINRID